MTMGMQINQLNIAEPAAGQSLPVYDPAKGDTRRWSLSDLTTWLAGILPMGRPEPNTQYAAPADGDTIIVDDSDDDTHLIIVPAGGLANLAITLPATGSVRDKQIVIVNCTQAIAALAINGNGSTVGAGAPTALLADEFFTLKYDVTLNTWYRIG
jgi:hypothetical protein